MISTRRRLIGAAAGAAVLPLVPVRAQGRPKIRIGVLTDLSGTYRDNTGPTSVAASALAVQEFASNAGFEVELLNADHQNKPDVGASLARQWFDNGVDVVADVPTSSVALAVAEVARQKDKIMLNASATVSSLTGEQCSPNTIVWSFDTYMNAKSTGGAVTRAGGDSWYFITADYAFGHSLEDFTAEQVKKSGGRVVGHVAYPFPDTTDFSAFLSQAAASGAKVLGLANAGLDTANCIKQANEFGINKQMKIAPLLMFIQNVQSLGLEVSQGLITTESFYWDFNDGTRRFTKRLLPSVQTYPNQAHASSYSSVLHYLKVVNAMGAAEAKKSGAATVARMKATPTDDDAFGKGSIRADGRGVFPAYLFQVKTPAESKYPWDYYKLIATTAGPEAIRPLDEENCRFAKS
ncbi:MAG: ABC transporter substrate-binding protein [Acetobacteraceae bacterium]|nr:ABC transporter substrate-binding protein [Acetobacteraceae bacterium]